MDDLKYLLQRALEITEYIGVADRLHEAAEAVLDHRLTEEQAVQMYKADDAHYIKDKIKHLKLQREFNNQEQNYSRAVRNVLENGWSRNKALAECRVTKSILKREIREAKQVGIALYYFNRRINYSISNSWTYRDEQSILDRLIDWRDSGEVTRFTKLTIYEKMSELAYQYVRANTGIKYPNDWNRYQRATVDWVKYFDMRHHDEIKELFKNVQVQECNIFDLEVADSI